MQTVHHPRFCQMYHLQEKPQNQPTSSTTQDDEQGGRRTTEEEAGLQELGGTNPAAPVEEVKVPSREDTTFRPAGEDHAFITKARQRKHGRRPRQANLSHPLTRVGKRESTEQHLDRQRPHHQRLKAELLPQCSFPRYQDK